jgi:hypothetical protein
MSNFTKKNYMNINVLIINEPINKYIIKDYIKYKEKILDYFYIE